MYLIEGVAFNEYEIESVKLNLITCVLTVNVIYHKDKKRIKKLQEFEFPTTCNVDINEYTKKVEEIIHGKNIL